MLRWPSWRGKSNGTLRKVTGKYNQLIGLIQNSNMKLSLTLKIGLKEGLNNLMKF